MRAIWLAPVILMGSGALAFADDGEICRAERGDAAMAACNRAIEASNATRLQIGEALLNRGQQFYERKSTTAPWMILPLRYP